MISNNYGNPVIFLLLSFLFLSCDPLATSWEDVEEAVFYRASKITTPPATVDTLVVMTWNIRYGGSRIPWFGDGCGERVLLTEDEVMNGLEGLTVKINQVDPDILILQEVDVESKRTAYVDELQWLLNHTSLNYGAYASVWESQFIPSDGIGRMDMGNAILTRWKISHADRIKLALREDQDFLTRYFYVRRNIVRAKINLPNYDNFYVIGIHAAAFTPPGYDTKMQHINRFKEELDNLDDMGVFFVAGGDLNALPPGSDSTDYCDEDKCPGESFHSPGDDPQHKEGSYYELEKNWLNKLYDDYKPAIPLLDYSKDNSNHFTYYTRDFSYGNDLNELGGRKLDYLFSNHSWVEGSDSTHLDAIELSDHIPVTAKLVVSE